VALRPVGKISWMRHVRFACSLFISVTLLFGAAALCAGSDQERLIVRDGKKMTCWVRFIDTMSGDCGTDSYDAVFTAKILAIVPMQRTGSHRIDSALESGPGSDLRFTVNPTEEFKGHPSRELQIFAEQGECIADVHVGDEWLFFARKSPKKDGFEISYYSSNPSGPIKSELGNLFPLFYVEVHALEGKQARGPFGTSIGDGLRFAVRGLTPGSYIIQLVNYQGETWLKKPVFAPGVTDKSTALRIDLGWAEHRTGLEIRVPTKALKGAH